MFVQLTFWNNFILNMSVLGEHMLDVHRGDEINKRNCYKCHQKAIEMFNIAIRAI